MSDQRAKKLDNTRMRAGHSARETVSQTIQHRYAPDIPWSIEEGTTWKAQPKYQNIHVSENKNVIYYTTKTACVSYTTTSIGAVSQTAMRSLAPPYHSVYALKDSPLPH